jgi:hypothetical protein
MQSATEDYVAGQIGGTTGSRLQSLGECACDARKVLMRLRTIAARVEKRSDADELLICRDRIRSPIQTICNAQFGRRTNNALNCRVLAGILVKLFRATCFAPIAQQESIRLSLYRRANGAIPLWRISF